MLTSNFERWRNNNNGAQVAFVSLRERLFALGQLSASDSTTAVHGKDASASAPSQNSLSVAVAALSSASASSTPDAAHAGVGPRGTSPPNFDNHAAPAGSQLPNRSSSSAFPCNSNSNKPPFVRKHTADDVAAARLKNQQQHLEVPADG